MDNVTHTLAGVAVANAFFRRRDGAEAVPILALASNLPDVDGVVMLSGDPASILLRRTFGHSLLLLPLWCAALAWLLGRAYPSLSFRRRLGLCLAGASVHLFLDLINSFGVVLLWPLSQWRPELAWVFIIDLVLAALLAAPLLLAWPRRLRPRLAGFSRLSVALASAYILFCGASRSLALSALREKTRAGPYLFVYAFAEPFGPHRWRGVVFKDGFWELYLVRPWSGAVEPKDRLRTWRGDPRVEAARATPLGAGLESFFMAPVWRAEACPEGPCGLASVHDLRFRPLVVDRGAAFEFRFRIGPDGTVERS